MLLPYYSIGSNAEKIETCLNKEFIYKHKPNFLVKTNHEVPIILSRDPDKIRLGFYGVENSKGNPITWHRTEGIIKKMRLRQLIRMNRCLIPANGFFIQHDKITYLFYSSKFPVLTFGGIWHEKNCGDFNQVYFSILTVPMIKKFQTHTARMPLIVSQGSQRRFLNINNPLMDVTKLFKYETNIEFNGYPVNPGIFKSSNVQKKDMKPIGKKIIGKERFPEKEIKGNYYLYIQ